MSITKLFLPISETGSTPVGKFVKKCPLHNMDESTITTAAPHVSKLVPHLYLTRLPKMLSDPLSQEEDCHSPHHPYCTSRQNCHKNLTSQECNSICDTTFHTSFELKRHISRQWFHTSPPKKNLFVKRFVKRDQNGQPILQYDTGLPQLRVARRVAELQR